MSLRVSAQANLTISQDNATNPQEITFSSGTKSKTDSTTYNESIGNTFDVPALAVDLQIELGSLSASQVMYLFSSTSGLLIKAVPVGGSLGATPALELIPSFPALMPFKIAALYVSNPGATAAKVIMGAAGN